MSVVLQDLTPICAKIVAQVANNKTLAALSGAWFWKNNNAKDLDGNGKVKSTGIKLNDQASKSKWNDTGSDAAASTESEFNKISIGVNGGTNGMPDRWRYYKNNVKNVLDGGNPYESMRSVLSRVGITTVTGKNYTQQFGMTLATHQVVRIGGNSTTSNLMADTSADLAETPDGADLTAEQESRLWNQAQPLFDKLKQSNEESAMWIPDLRDASLLAGAVAALSSRLRPCKRLTNMYSVSAKYRELILVRKFAR